jgi:hypothetical protein
VAVAKLERAARLWEILAFVGVMLLSPASLVIVLPFGVAPDFWLEFWLKYVFIFIILALLVAGAGLSAASSAWVKAERIRIEMMRSKA